MLLNVRRNHKAYRYGEKGGGVGLGVWRWGKREITYPSLHSNHIMTLALRMRSVERHFNVSLPVVDKVTR